MSLMRDDLRTYLLSQSTVTAYTSNIFVVPAPDNFQEDHIRIQKIVPGNDPDSFGDTKFNSETWQIDIFSLNSDVPEELGNIIVDLLNRFQGTMSGQDVRFSTAEGPLCEPDTTDIAWTHGVVFWRPRYHR